VIFREESTEDSQSFFQGRENYPAKRCDYPGKGPPSHHAMRKWIENGGTAMLNAELERLGAGRGIARSLSLNLPTCWEDS